MLKWATFCLEQEINEDVFGKFRVGANSHKIEINGQVTFPLGKKEDANLTLGFHGVNLHKPDREVKWGSQFEFNI